MPAFSRYRQEGRQVPRAMPCVHLWWCGQEGWGRNLHNKIPKHNPLLPHNLSICSTSEQICKSLLVISDIYNPNLHIDPLSVDSIRRTMWRLCDFVLRIAVGEMAVNLIISTMNME